MTDFNQECCSISQRPCCGYGSGKLILLGEHSVVYGKPAIATSIKQGAKATVSGVEGMSHSRLAVSTSGSLLEISSIDDEMRHHPMAIAFFEVLEQFGIENLSVEIELDLPIKSGLGSSAAIATALVRACAKYACIDSDLPIDRAIAGVERVFHGAPSGIDQAAAGGEGVFLFRAGKVRRHLDVHTLPLVVCVADNPSSTIEEVNRVRRLHERRPDYYATLDDLVEMLVNEGADALRAHDYAALGSLMTENHRLLYAMGCSTPAIERAREVALAANATGAKVTGAGGGGCVIALGRNDAEQAVILDAWKTAGFHAFTTDVSRHQWEVGVSESRC